MPNIATIRFVSLAHTCSPTLHVFLTHRPHAQRMAIPAIYLARRTKQSAPAPVRDASPVSDHWSAPSVRRRAAVALSPLVLVAVIALLCRLV